jgi:hypothetical protein
MTADGLRRPSRWKMKIKRQPEHCRICNAELKPGCRYGLCAWCKQVEDGRREVHDREEFYSLKGYQPLSPRGGRIWTRHPDPGKG